MPGSTWQSGQGCEPPPPPKPCQPAPPGANLLLASVGVLSGRPCPRHPEPCKPGPQAERGVCVCVRVSESVSCLCLHQKDLSNQPLTDLRNRAESDASQLRLPPLLWGEGPSPNPAEGGGAGGASSEPRRPGGGVGSPCRDHGPHSTSVCTFLHVSVTHEGSCANVLRKP